MFPEAEMLHMIDDMDAKMNEMEAVVKRTPAGAFSEKIWSLDRRVYHPNYPEKAPAEEENAFRPDAQKAYDGLL